MRFFLAVSWSILKARFSLSAVSSSTELLAVLTSRLSFFSRSMTSALSTPSSRASWNTRTLCITLVPALHDAGCGRRGGRCARSLARLFGSRLLGRRLRERLLGSHARGFGRLLARLLLGVLLVPLGLGLG